MVDGAVPCHSATVPWYPACAVMLNDTALYDLLLTDELMDNFLGAMECVLARLPAAATPSNAELAARADCLNRLGSHAALCHELVQTTPKVA